MKTIGTYKLGRTPKKTGAKNYYIVFIQQNKPISFKQPVQPCQAIYQQKRKFITKIDAIRRKDYAFFYRVFFRGKQNKSLKKSRGEPLLDGMVVYTKIFVFFSSLKTYHHNLETLKEKVSFK
jgi:hypothetical protein